MKTISMMAVAAATAVSALSFTATPGAAKTAAAGPIKPPEHYCLSYEAGSECGFTSYAQCEAMAPDDRRRLAARRHRGPEFSRAAQVCIDARLPALAGSAISLDDILVESKRDRGFRLARQWWSSTADQFLAMAQLSMAEEIAQQFRRVVGITGDRLAEISCASAFPLFHGSRHV
jgi:hypothetical protein